VLASTVGFGQVKTKIALCVHCTSVKAKQRFLAGLGFKAGNRVAGMNGRNRNVTTAG